MELTQRELQPGLRLTAIQTDKFKTSMLAFSFLAPLSKETAAANALLPALLRRGSQHYPDMLTISAALDDLYGGSIEPMVRKKGELQCIGFVGSFLDDRYIPEDSQVLEQAVAFMGELLLHPAGTSNAFVDAYLDSEKEQLTQRIRARINDKQQYALHRLISQMCEGEAYGVDKLGEESEVAAITNESLWTCYQSLLREAPIAIYYCGCAPVERVEAALRSALADLPRGERLNRLPETDTKLFAPQQTRYVEDRLDVTQGKLALGLRLGAPCTDANATVTALVFNAIYGGSTNAKLFLNVRERLSLCYYANSMLDKHKGLLIVSSGVAFDQYERARDEILAQLEDCKKGKISDEEFTAAQSFVLNSLQLTADTQGRLEDFWLGQAVAGQNDTPDQLTSATKALTVQHVQTLAQGIVLDTVYFLQGREESAS